jgi:protein-disulfide isomerase-like protein with CxxC motif
LDVVLVNVWEGTGAAEEAAAYCQRWGIEGTVVLDESASYARRLGIRGVPTNVLVDESGTVRAVGASSSADLLRAAARLEPRLADATGDLLRARLNPHGFGADDQQRN